MLFSANLDTSLYSLPFLFWVEAALLSPSLLAPCHRHNTSLPPTSPPKDISTGRRIFQEEKQKKNQHKQQTKHRHNQTNPKQRAASRWLSSRGAKPTNLSPSPAGSPAPLTLPLSRNTPWRPPALLPPRLCLSQTWRARRRSPTLPPWCSPKVPAPSRPPAATSSPFSPLCSAAEPKTRCGSPCAWPRVPREVKPCRALALRSCRGRAGAEGRRGGRGR